MAIELLWPGTRTERGASGCLAKCLVTEGVGPGNILVAGLILGVMLGP